MTRIVTATAALCCALTLSSTPAAAQVFRDDFNGAELDTTVWSIDPGDGQVTVADGFVTLSCPGNVFPVVTTRNDPFPSGDFRIQIGMQYVAQNFCGDGFGAMDNFWEDYYGTACRPFLLWQDGGGLYVYTGSTGNTLLTSPPELGYHIYEWRYINGQYEFSMDGVVRATGGCAPRATQIFFGHPHPISCAPWTSFAIDFIEISADGATDSKKTSWGRLKQSYRAP